MSKLLELMRKLGSDAGLAAEYEKNPEAVLLRAGLNEEERRAMLEKDYEAIKRLTGLGDGRFATNHLIRTYED
jgi:3-methyladenine DNA glycosylase Mpg